MHKYLFRFSLLFLVTLIVSSCGKDDPVIPNEEELITTVNYLLTPTSGGDAVTLSFVDLDGDNGAEPTITGGNLVANQSYIGSLELLNEAESPVEDITVEVEEEDEDHQFFFQTDVANLSITYDDQDADGNPVGLKSTLTTGDAAMGTLTIILRHKPEKSESGVSDGIIDNAGGDTDIEVNFPIIVQ